MAEKIFFITGTDTEVGKTFVTTHLLRKYKQENKTAFGLKPIASGAEYIQNHLVNEDALLIKKFSNCNLEYSEINPFVFKEAIAPHIAAKIINQEIDINNLSKIVLNTINKYYDQADFILIEGAGGFLTPINFRNTYADLIKLLQVNYEINIILVVKIKLGCINHALLTEQYILNNNFKFHGWIANDFDITDQVLQENVNTLKKFLKAPLLFNLPRV